MSATVLANSRVLRLQPSATSPTSTPQTTPPTHSTASAPTDRSPPRLSSLPRTIPCRMAVPHPRELEPAAPGGREGRVDAGPQFSGRQHRFVVTSVPCLCLLCRKRRSGSARTAQPGGTPGFFAPPVETGAGARHRPVSGCIQTQNHDWLSMTSSSDFGTYPIQ